MNSFFLEFWKYIPLIIKLFSVGVVLGLLYYYFFMRKNFIIKLPFETFSSKEITLSLLPIEKSNTNFVKKYDNLVVTYKQDVLLSFTTIKEYCNFCNLLNNYFNQSINARQGVDTSSLINFFNALEITYDEANIFFPGHFNKDANIYEEIYCKFSDKSAKFIFNYMTNKTLCFSILLLQLSLVVRDHTKFVRENKDQGLEYLDVYFNSFIRSKHDVLQLWYFLISLQDFINNSENFERKIDLYGETATSTYRDPDYITFKHNFFEFTKNLTKSIINDFARELSFFEKGVLFYFLIKPKFESFVLKYSPFAFFDDLPFVLKQFFSLLPLTVLLFLIYNTNYSVTFGAIFTIYIGIFATKRGFIVVKNLMNYNYYTSKRRKVNVVILFILQHMILICFNLIILSISIWLLSSLSSSTHNMIYLCFYLSFCLTWVVDACFKIKNKINKITN